MPLFGHGNPNVYRLGQEQLSRLLFPLGELQKGDVRSQSAAWGLATAMKAESMDICFVPQGDYGDVIRKLRPEAAQEGPLLSTSGEELGRHQGIAFYTVGQRKGLGVSSAAPLYVVKLDKARNAVIVGDEKELLGAKIAGVEAACAGFPTASRSRRSVPA